MSEIIRLTGEPERLLTPSAPPSLGKRNPANAGSRSLEETSGLMSSKRDISGAWPLGINSESLLFVWLVGKLLCMNHYIVLGKRGDVV